MHTADEVSEVRLMGEIDDELDDVSDLIIIRFVRSEKLMSDNELDEDCKDHQADEC